MRGLHLLGWVRLRWLTPPLLGPNSSPPIPSTLGVVKDTYTFFYLLDLTFLHYFMIVILFESIIRLQDFLSSLVFIQYYHKILKK